MSKRLACAALCLALPGAALATVVMDLTVEELTARAPLVVRATASQSQAAFSAAERGIWTYTELSVSETMKGPAARTVLVKQPGGAVGGRALAVAGAARFNDGEEAVLFLEPAVDEPGVYVVMSLAAGKVSLEQRLGVRTAVRHLEGISFASPQRGVRPVAEVEVLGRADAFLARVRSAAHGAKR